MVCGKYLCAFLLFLLGTASGFGAPGYAIEIDLHDQLAYLIADDRVVLSTPISSGRTGYHTAPGSFKIIEKERNHFSNLYGKIVNARGRTIVADADADMPLPRGARFVPAPMRYFMRYNGAEGMHAGVLPGYPASHGCVRLPQQNAMAIFETVPLGTPVTVFGRTPSRRRLREYAIDRRPSTPYCLLEPRRREPMFDPRFAQPPDDWDY